MLQKRFSIYTCFLHVFIVSLFVFWGSGEEHKEEDEKIESRIVEIDVFQPARNAVMAETISDEDYINDILSTEDAFKTYTQDEKIKMAEDKENIRSKEARIIQAKKANDRKIAREKEKERIKKENEILKKKIEEDKKQLKIEKEKELKEIAKIERSRAEKRKRDLALKEEERKREIAAAAQKNKVIKSNNKPLSKNEWLKTSNGKRDYAEYSSSLYNKVHSQWVKPFHAKTGWNCTLKIIQDSKGRVKNIKNIDCNPDNIKLKNSVQKAVMKASPLPIPRDLRLFDQTVIFKFSVE